MLSVSSRTSPSNAMPDLSSPATFLPQPPYEAWAAIRSAPRLHRQQRAGAPDFYSVTGYQDTRTVLRDAVTFGSEWGMTLDSALGRPDPASGLMIELTDPPRHARLRRLVTGVITPQFVRSLELVVRDHAERLVRSATAAGEVDVVAALTAPMPRLTIGAILGLPDEDADRVAELASQAITGTTAQGDPHASLAERRLCSEAANADLLVYFWGVLDEPERLAPGGLVRRLMEVDIDGARLSEEEVLYNCLNLAIGGNETTKNAAAAGIAAICTDPARWDWLRQDPARLDPAIEEMLRFNTPAMHLVRTVTRSTTLGGTELSEGDTVCVWIAAANRDPEVFESPDEFRIDRSPNPHLAFTVGPHFCLGAVLARLEMRTLFGELLAKVGSITPLAPVVRRPSNFIAGIDQFRVALSAA
jgi:cytochrome P450